MSPEAKTEIEWSIVDAAAELHYAAHDEYNSEKSSDPESIYYKVAVKAIETVKAHVEAQKNPIVAQAIELAHSIATKGEGDATKLVEAVAVAGLL